MDDTSLDVVGNMEQRHVGIVKPPASPTNSVISSWNVLCNPDAFCHTNRVNQYHTRAAQDKILTKSREMRQAIVDSRRKNREDNIQTLRNSAEQIVSSAMTGNTPPVAVDEGGGDTSVVLEHKHDTDTSQQSDGNTNNNNTEEEKKAAREEEFKRLYEAELNDRLYHLEQRLQDKHENEIHSIRQQQRQSMEAQSQLQKELEYYRQKANLERKSAVTQTGMSLVLFSNIIESACTAFNIKRLNLNGLSKNVETGLESGDFDVFINNISNDISTMRILQNPYLAFMTAFGGVLLQTHIKNGGKSNDKEDDGKTKLDSSHQPVVNDSNVPRAMYYQPPQPNNMYPQQTPYWPPMQPQQFGQKINPPIYTPFGSMYGFQPQPGTYFASELHTTQPQQSANHKDTDQNSTHVESKTQEEDQNNNLTEDTFDLGADATTTVPDIVMDPVTQQPRPRVHLQNLEKHDMNTISEKLKTFVPVVSTYMKKSECESNHQKQLEELEKSNPLTNIL